MYPFFINYIQMNITLNCDNITICPVSPENFDSVLEFDMSISKDCCANSVYETYYKNLPQTLTLDLKYWIRTSYTPGANLCEGYFNTSYWFDIVGLNMATVQSITSVTQRYNGLTLVSTVNNAYIIYGVPTGQQIYEDPGYDKEHNVVTITLNSGLVITLTYNILYNGATCVVEVRGTPLVASMAIDLSSVSFSYNSSNLGNTFELTEDGCILIEKDITSGYYTTEVQIEDLSEKKCQIVDCEGTLPCSVSKAITDLISTSCYECSKENNIEQAFQIKLLYEIITSEIDCDDCCSKCLAYEKLNNLLTNCTSC